MARPKEFDKEEVLTKAMHTFWRYGYEGTSMQTLVSNMGINRGSLYDTFGDKRSLFLAAIAHYEQTVVSQMMAPLFAADANKQTIINLFHELVAKTISADDYYGCFVTNIAVELCPQDRDTQSRIEQKFQQLTSAFKVVLVKAQAQGEISSDRNLDSIAQYLTSSLQGLRVISKVNRDPATLNNIVNVILSTID